MKKQALAMWEEGQRLNVPRAQTHRRPQKVSGERLGLQAVGLTIPAVSIAATNCFEPDPQREIDPIA